MCSGITRGSTQWRALCTKITEVHIYTKILEVNFFAFAYGLFHEDFSPINATLHDTQPFSSYILLSTLPLVIPEQILII